jgi:hypothetical protein
MIIEQGKIAMDLVKLGGIRDWPTLTTVKQVRSFLGWKLLSKVYLPLFRPHSTPQSLDKEGQEV